MNLSSFVRGLTAVGAAVLASGAMAQAQQPMAEVIGQPIQVTTNGVTNTLYFDANGAVRIITPNSNVVQGTWTMSQGKLCVTAGSAQECWPYSAPFQPQQPVTYTSSCSSTSTWVAQATNTTAQPQKGERGQ